MCLASWGGLSGRLESVNAPGPLTVLLQFTAMDLNIHVVSFRIGYLYSGHAFLQLKINIYVYLKLYFARELTLCFVASFNLTHKMPYRVKHGN